MATNYIYLLQEREFLKTKENIYKVGMTEKENYTRFNQYPKGSILLFQMICKDCKIIEKHILQQFKLLFDQRKEIGIEYFKGNYEQMIDIIYTIIKDEKAADENNQPTHEDKCNIKDGVSDMLDDNIKENNTSDDDDDTPDIVYNITTYAEWSKINCINKVIITNKKTHEGFLKFKGRIWRPLHNTHNLDTYDEDLLGYIEHNKKEYVIKHKTTHALISVEEYNKLSQDDMQNYEHVHHVKYDIEQIIQDTLNSCYVKSPTFYYMNYHEYVFYNCNDKQNAPCVMYDALTGIFTPIDEIIQDKILTTNISSHPIYAYNTVNIDIVDDILNTLITYHVKWQYKWLAYNLIVKQEAQEIIFYDHNEGLLTTWLRDLLFTLSPKQLYIHSYDYYYDKKEFKKLLKTNHYRLAIIHTNNLYINKSIKNDVLPSSDTQLSEFKKMGFKYFIIRGNDKTNEMYNIPAYIQYLHNNKDIILDYCIKEKCRDFVEHWDQKILDRYDDLFYHSELLYTNFLKWCCVK